MKNIRKMSLITILIILLSFLLLACEEEPVEEEVVELYPAYESEGNDQIWGYIDGEGEYVVEPKYDTAYNYDGGIGLVEKNGKFGVLDGEGNQLIPVEYTNVGKLKNGYFTAYKANEINVFDALGEEVEIKKKYSNVGNFSDGYFTVSKIGKDGKIRFGYIDEDGKEAIKPKYDAAYDFIKGRAIVKDGNKFKIIDSRDRVKKEMEYTKIRPTIEEEYYIYSENGKSSGVIDYQGEVIIEAKYNSIVDVEDDMAIVGKIIDGNELFGVVDLKNQEVLPAKYDDVKNIGEGLLAISDEVGLIGKNIYQIVNNKGQPINEDKFYNVTGRIGRVTSGVISVSDGEETFFIDTDGIVQNEMPVVVGYGELDYDGKVIKAIVDEELLYYNKKNQVIWEANNTFDLGQGREIIQEHFKDGKKISIDYPLFVGFTDRIAQENINDQLAKGFLSVDGSDMEIDEENFKYYKTIYEVTNGSEYVAIEKTSKMMEIDSVEENLSKRIFNVDLESGEFYTLKDIFKKDSGYIDRLNGIVNNISENIESTENRKLRDVEKNDCFKLSDDYLFLYLTYDQTKDEVKGYEKVSIKIDDIKDMLNRENGLVESKVFIK